MYLLKATATTKKSMLLLMKDHRKVPENDFGRLPQSKDSQRVGGGPRDGGKSSSAGLAAPIPPANGDSPSQGERFGENDGLENRRLLWHGTNIAVVAAILKSGLRIMPHSGGRVGRGIYFASENSKSAGYGEADSTAAGNSLQLKRTQ